MSKLDQAIKFAVDAHTGQKRKLSGAAYIVHPLECMIIVGQLTKDEDVLVATVLHDVVEDTNVTIEEVEKAFGARVAELVTGETENKRKELPPEATWKIRKEESLHHLEECGDRDVKMMWLGDKLSNIRSMAIEYISHGDEIFNHFNQKNKKEHEWYYRRIADLLREDFKDKAAFMEYDALVNYIFGDQAAKQ